jgi:hypothetical protein
VETVNSLPFAKITVPLDITVISSRIILPTTLNTSTSVKSRVPPVIVTVLPLTPSLFVLAKA